MTDGNTGFQVAPITEDDMSKVRDILQRALDAIVGMSKLSADVDQLSRQVSQLSDDAERLRKANAGLEESLYQARTQRMALEDRLTAAEQAKITAQRESEDWQSKANSASTQVESLSAELGNTKHERDDAQLKVMELEDQLKATQSKISSIHQALGIVPAPEAVPSAPPAPPSLGPVVQQPTETTSPAASPIDPVPTPVKPEPKRIYTDRWMPGALWDTEKSQYYTEVHDELIPF